MPKKKIKKKQKKQKTKTKTITKKTPKTKKEKKNQKTKTPKTKQNKTKPRVSVSVFFSLYLFFMFFLNQLCISSLFFFLIYVFIFLFIYLNWLFISHVRRTRGNMKVLPICRFIATVYRVFFAQCYFHPSVFLLLYTCKRLHSVLNSPKQGYVKREVTCSSHQIVPTPKRTG